MFVKFMFGAVKGLLYEPTYENEVDNLIPCTSTPNSTFISTKIYSLGLNVEDSIHNYDGRLKQCRRIIGASKPTAKHASQPA
jgi:hypothetical protein